MSSFYKQTKHPVTGKWELAQWLDDYFGKHRYGVLFPSEPDGFVLDADKWNLETKDTVEVVKYPSGKMTANGIDIVAPIPYNRRDHQHCFDNKNPPCGQKIEHLKCCLCELQNPEASKNTIKIEPANRIDYCSDCDMEHGYECPKDAPAEDWHKTFLDAGTRELGMDCSILIGVINTLITQAVEEGRLYAGHGESCLKAAESGKADGRREMKEEILNDLIKLNPITNTPVNTALIYNMIDSKS